MSHPLAAAFRSQARSCADLGSPFMARLCSLLAQGLRPGTPLTDRLFDWPGDLSPAGDSVPLRLCGALHALARGGRAGLAAVYPPHDVPEAALWQAVAAALRDESAFIDRFIDLSPQTNDVRRSAALIAAAQWLTARSGLPLVLSELGASAGLNLTFDQYGLIAGGHRHGPADAALTLAPDWRGPALPAVALQVADRRGADIAPLDRRRDADRVMSYLWPDQPHRAALTAAALALPAPAVDRADAAAWLGARLATARPGHLHLIFHTVAWQYFSPDTVARAEAALEHAGARATTDAPIAHFGMETCASGRPGAALTLRLWPGDLTLAMGRADFHGRWIDWQPPA